MGFASVEAAQIAQIAADVLTAWQAEPSFQAGGGGHDSGAAVLMQPTDLLGGAHSLRSLAKQLVERLQRAWQAEADIQRKTEEQRKLHVSLKKWKLAINRYVDTQRST